MKKKTKPLLWLWLVFFSILSVTGYGQLSLAGQLRVRTEFRDGYGTLRLKTNNPSFFTSQRARLTFNYKFNKVIFQTSIQDVRVWGQDASTINNADGTKLSVHEAWAEIILSNKKDSGFNHSSVDYLSIKIGRQELLYDDSRLLGNLDWLQQARRHDAIVLKFLNKGWQVDAGAAFNQNTDAINYNGTYYTPANVQPYVKDSKGNLVPTPTGFIPLTNAAGWSTKNGVPSLINMPGTNNLTQAYKAMQFLYAAKQIGNSKITALFFADQFGKYKLDSVQTIAGSDTGFVYGRKYNQSGANARFTTGMLAAGTLSRNKQISYTAGFYYQAGKDKDGNKLAGFTTTATISLTRKRFAYTLGWDYVSGNDAFSSSATNHRFDPLYGTPHKFWGLMDYFYAATGSPTGGLSNPFAKVRYVSSNNRFTLVFDYHYFSLAQNQKDLNGNAIQKYLGSELDLVAGYNLNKMVNLESGFAYMAATKSMEYAKNISPGTAKLNSTWAYIQVNIRPEFAMK